MNLTVVGVGLETSAKMDSSKSCCSGSESKKVSHYYRGSGELVACVRARVFGVCESFTTFFTVSFPLAWLHCARNTHSITLFPPSPGSRPSSPSNISLASEPAYLSYGSLHRRDRHLYGGHLPRGGRSEIQIRNL